MTQRVLTSAQAQQQPLTSLPITIFCLMQDQVKGENLSGLTVRNRHKEYYKHSTSWWNFFQLVGKPWLMEIFGYKTFDIILVPGKVMSTKN